MRVRSKNCIGREVGWVVGLSEGIHAGGYRSRRYSVDRLGAPRQWHTEGGSYAHTLHKVLLRKMLNVIFSHYACNGSKQIT